MDSKKIFSLLLKFSETYFTHIFSIRILMIVVFSAILIGFFLGRFSNRHSLNNWFTIGKIDQSILIVSVLLALLCLGFGIFNQSTISIEILSFYSTFIFSWLLTKYSSKKEYIERQNDIAKSTYRHITDIRTAALVTKRRLEAIRKKTTISKSDVDGILDNLETIMSCINTNEADWMDMLSPDYLKKLQRQKDPEENKETNENVAHPGDVKKWLA